MHIPVDSAIEGEIRILRVDSVIHIVVRENQKFVLFSQVFINADLECRVSAVMGFYKFSVQINDCGCVHSREFNVQLLVFIKGWSLKNLFVAACPTEIIVASILPVDVVPCMRDNDFFCFNCLKTVRTGAVLIKQPVSV